eukprot:tig00000692_g3201.t1
MGRVAGVEAGGTSFVVAVGTPPHVEERAEFPTREPAETLNDVVTWLSSRKFDALGIASFGPVDLNEKSATYGHITTTPKPRWANTDVVGAFKRFGVPTAFETDVNAAAIGEAKHGGHGAVSSVCYVTVGTGIGVGIVVDGKPLHGLLHPEGGHFRQPRLAGDAFAGSCPFHADCVEGMASAGAIAGRAGVAPAELKNLPDDHPAWEAAAHYLGHLCATLTLIVSPEVIVLSGGVLQRLSLFPKIRRVCLQMLQGYIRSERLQEGPSGIDRYIVPSVHGNNAGIVGALTIAPAN